MQLDTGQPNTISDRDPSTPKITVDLLREFLDYIPDTGQIIWRFRNPRWFSSVRDWRIWNTRYANQPAFITCDDRGYLKGDILGRAYYAHRVAFTIYHGRDIVGQIDHINRDKSDNRIVNLREVSHRDNQRNLPRFSSNTSGTVGVCWDRRTQSWLAYIGSSPVRHLGRFKTLEEAVEVRKSAEKHEGYHENHGK